MAIFVPSRGNIKFLKSLLMGDFEMKSSHATEAIAALIGFRSNASFRAHVEIHNQMTAFHTDFERFGDRSQALGYEEDSSEHLRDIFTSIDFPDPAWRMIRKADMLERDKWYYSCEARKTPFMVIAKARTLCTLDWDHISMDPSYDELVRETLGENHGRFLFRLFRLAISENSPKALFDGNALVGSVKNLSEADARILANEFAQVIFPGNLTARRSEAA